MKLNRSVSGVLAVIAVALACGCSTTRLTHALNGPLTGQNPRAVDPNLTGTTNLMSAEMAGPAPKVGVSKAHLSNDYDTLGSTKETRRDDGSRRGGGFGTSK